MSDEIYAALNSLIQWLKINYPDRLREFRVNSSFFNELNLESVKSLCLSSLLLIAFSEDDAEVIDFDLWEEIYYSRLEQDIIDIMDKLDTPIELLPLITDVAEVSIEACMELCTMHPFTKESPVPIDKSKALQLIIFEDNLMHDWKSITTELINFYGYNKVLLTTSSEGVLH